MSIVFLNSQMKISNAKTLSSAASAQPRDNNIMNEASALNFKIRMFLFLCILIAKPLCTNDFCDSLFDGVGLAGFKTRVNGTLLA